MMPGMMVARIKNAWQALRANYWGALAFDVTLIIVAFMLVHTWQTRNLPGDDYTPALELSWLDELQADSILVSGETGVVYFFAPWCSVCRRSIGNLEELVNNGELPWARAVALDYENLDEVRAFIRETDVHLPVLLGGPQTMRDWQIQAFPTYFVIDGDGQIVSRSVGYSTKIGLQARVWMNKN